jgi:hypothetical protein
MNLIPPQRRPERADGAPIRRARSAASPRLTWPGLRPGWLSRRVADRSISRQDDSLRYPVGYAARNQRPTEPIDRFAIAAAMIIGIP